MTVRYILLSLVLLYTSLHAATEASVTMHASAQQVSVGDELRITVSYRWPSDWTTTADPSPLHTFEQADLFITDIPPVRISDTGAQMQREWVVTVIAQYSGPWLLPQPSFTCTSPTGEERVSTASELLIQVGTDSNPPKLAPASDLWRIGDDSSQQPTSYTTWFISGFVLLIVLVIYFIRKQKPPAIIITPYEHFQSDLLSIDNCTTGKSAGSLLSQALRRYCGTQGNFDGEGATTKEMRQLVIDSLPAEQVRSLCRILENIDALRWQPDDYEKIIVMPLVEQTKEWVQGEEQRLAKLAEAANDTDGDRS